MARKRYRSSDPGDFDQQYSSGKVSQAFGASNDSFEQSFPDQDWPPQAYPTIAQNESDFQGYAGHAADFGHSTLKIPERRALGVNYRNPLAYTPKAFLPPKGSAPVSAFSGMGEIASIFSSVKWIALAGVVVFAYYKMKEHKSDIKSIAKVAHNAVSTARAAVTKSNPSAAELWSSEKSNEDPDEESIGHRHLDDDED